MGCCDKGACSQVTFYQWTTAKLLLIIGGENPLQDTRDILVSFVQGETELDFHKDDLEVDEEASTVTVSLSQEDTGSFRVDPNGTGKVNVQVNVYYEDSDRDATGEGEITILRNLYKKVME